MTKALALAIHSTTAPACRINTFRKNTVARTASAYRSLHVRTASSLAVRPEQKGLPMLMLRGPVRTSFAGLI